MSTRDALARLALPLLGAAAVTAGAVLVQITRKPGTESREGESMEPRPARALYSAPGVGSVSRSTTSDGPDSDDASLLQRLRERGL